ncbi:unnamed protein product, partial [Prorocentrum cordatum]
VLISFWGDPNGLRCRGRILLVATPTPGKWIVGTPDFDVQLADLAEHRVIPLGRDEDLPRRLLPETYFFDVPIAAESLARMRRAGRDLLEVFGSVGAAGAAPQRGRWRVSDPAHEAFGDEVPEGVIGDGEQMVIRESVALVCIDEEWASAALVEEADLAEWRHLKAAGLGKDPRLLGDERIGGQPHMSFQTVAKLSRPANRPGWPFQGKAGAPELQRALMTANHDFISHHLDWRTKSGVNLHGVVCRLHRRLCETPSMLYTYDQVDPSNVAGAECLSRWLFEVDRGPPQPEGALARMAAAAGAEGAADAAAESPRPPGRAASPCGGCGGGLLGSIPDVVCLAAAFLELDVGAKLIEVTIVRFVAVPMATRSPFRTWAKVSRFSSRPSLSPCDAVHGLLKSTGMYSHQPQHLRPYDLTKLRVLQGLVTPRPLCDRLPPVGVQALDRADSVLYRAAAEIDALSEQGLIVLVRPYWGPRLRRDMTARRDFVMRLRAVSLVGFRLAIPARIGSFFMAKKGGELRLVLGGREASSLHRRPPHSALGSAGALAGLDLSPQALRRAGLADAGVDPRGAGVDLRGGLYQFVDDDLADWFGFDFAEPAGYYDILDVCAELGRVNLVFHEKVEPTRLYESFGVVFDGQARKLRHTDARAWKLYLRLQHLLGVGGATGCALRIIYGHLVHFFMLLRRALAVLDLGFHFIAEHRERFAKFDSDLMEELRVAKWLVFLVEVDLVAPWAPCGVLQRRQHLRLRVRERWRFLDVEPDFPRGSGDRPLAAMGAEATTTLATRLVGDPAFDFDDDYRGGACLDRRPSRTTTLELDGIVQPVSDSVVDRRRWALIVRGAWRYAAPIHVKEARAQLLGLFRASRGTGMHGHRIGSLGDNMSALLSFEKGRARDYGLRQLCRVAAARQIATDIQWRQQCVETDRNPTDHDSGGRPGRGAAGPAA